MAAPMALQWVVPMAAQMVGLREILSVEQMAGQMAALSAYSKAVMRVAWKADLSD